MYISLNLEPSVLSLQGGHTPLIWAAMNGHAAVAALLLEKGADKDAKNNVSNRRHCPCERIHVGDRQ